MNIEGLEVRVKYGITTYWKDGLLIGKKCTKCGEDKEISNFRIVDKAKGNCRSECRECERKKTRENTKNNPNKVRENNKKWRENNLNKVKEYGKQWRENNVDKKRECNKRWRENNPEYDKQYRQDNVERRKECGKMWRENNPDYRKEYDKQYRQNIKKNNLQYISSIVEQINPIFKQLNLPIYGYIYLFTNTKTKRCYVGQTIQPLKVRYRNLNIIQGWIEDRKSFKNQKFKEELIEKDIEVVEMLDIGFCQYHLDKLEAYYIHKYNSYVDGYNNNAGYHNTNDGLEEFNKILSQYNIEFINGEIKEKRLPKQA
jgi:hypothetical protein